MATSFIMCRTDKFHQKLISMKLSLQASMIECVRKIQYNQKIVTKEIEHDHGVFTLSIGIDQLHVQGTNGSLNFQWLTNNKHNTCGTWERKT